MTVLLDALRRIEKQRPSRGSVPASAVAAPAATVEQVALNSADLKTAESPEPTTLRLPRREKPAAAMSFDPPLNARATVAADVAAAAAAIAHRFRGPALVTLVTCGDSADDVEVVESIGAALESQGFPTTVFHAERDLAAVYSLTALQDLRGGRGYHLLHTTTEAALEQTPLLGAADGVVMLIELERTSIQEAEAAVGTLRREAIAVSGILLIA